MRKDLVRFFGKCCLLGLPVLLFAAIYLIGDPFRVLYRYEFGDYYGEVPYSLDWDYVSTEMLLSRYQKTPYDAFIFGSSRSFTYHCSNWIKHIPGAKPFHYPAASETLYGVYTKVKLIDRIGLKMRHALLVLDSFTLGGVTPPSDHTHIVHPTASGGSWWEFHLVFLKAALQKFFIVKYADYSLFGQLRPYMLDIFQDTKKKARVDPSTNEYHFDGDERELATDADRYYRERAQYFPKREKKVDPSVIGELNRQYLE